MMLRDVPDYLEGNDRYEGYMADLTRELAKRLNIRYTLKLVEDGKYGTYNANGSWDGMIGEVIDGVSNCLSMRFSSDVTTSIRIEKCNVYGHGYSRTRSLLLSRSRSVSVSHIANRKPTWQWQHSR